MEGRLEYLSRAIMSAKSCNVRPSSSSDGEFLHDLEEKLEVMLLSNTFYIWYSSTVNGNTNKFRERIYLPLRLDR